MNTPIHPAFRKTLLCAALCTSGHAMAAGLLTPTNAALPELEIQQHHVNVVIEDGYAITSVEQVFANPHGSDLDAVYSFPIPAQAAVGEFTYWIDGQPVTGEVLAKQQARAIYEEERQAGRATALTEQDEYKTFDISVSPVRAGQDVRLKLTYIQPAQVETGVGRYVYPLEDGGVDEERLAFWTYNDEVHERFSFKLAFRSSYPIDGLRLPQHPQAHIQQLSEQQWSVDITNEMLAAAGVAEEAAQETLATSEGAEAATAPTGAVQHLDKDIVVYWRLQQGLPGAVDLVSYRAPGADQGTFMMTVTPGDDLGLITEGRDWIFVLDYSGSMEGKYQSMVEGIRQGLSKLHPNDRFRVVIFNDRARELTGGFVTATAEHVAEWARTLEQTRPQGSTNLYDGLQLGINSLDADRSSALILVTDGVANVGVTEKKDFLHLLEQHDVRLHTFVMGNSANRPLLEEMTQVSNGFALDVSNSDDIVGRLMEASSRLTHEALHDVALDISGIKVGDLSPADIGTLYRGQQLVVFGHYWGEGEATVALSGKISGEDKAWGTRFSFPAQSALHPELERLWAFATIEDLLAKMDYFGKDGDTEQAVTDLAVQYGLVTDYTSLLVLREEQFSSRGIARDNAARVATEQAARVQREQQPVRNNRVDNSQPMYTSPAPTHGGGNGSGALGPWFLLLLLPLLLAGRARGRAR